MDAASFLASLGERTYVGPNGRAYGTAVVRCRPSVRNGCIVAKRCVVEKNFLHELLAFYQDSSRKKNLEDVMQGKHFQIWG